MNTAPLFVEIQRLPAKKGPRPRLVLDRFLGKIDYAEGGCWLWTAHINAWGYGTLKVEGQPKLAHRVSYELFVGPIPDGLEIDHICRRPSCVNPDHLEAVTSHENNMRSRSVGALNAVKTHCPKGHDYSPENTYRYADGRRSCRVCHRERSRLARAARRVPA